MRVPQHCNPIAPQTKVKTGLISGDSHNEVWQFVNIKNALSTRSKNVPITISSDTSFRMTIDTTIIVTGEPYGNTVTNEHSFELKLQSGSTNVTVNWGDGSSDVITSNTDPSLVHDYGVGNEGVYQISIDGSFEGIGNPSDGSNYDNAKWISLDNWGTNSFKNMNQAFSKSINMIGTYTDIPDTSLCTDMSFMFNGCTNFNSPVNFDTSSNTTFEASFTDCISFNQPINWDTQNVESFLRCFANCTNFNSPVTLNGLLSVTSMNSMFASATNFNSLVTFSTPTSITNMGAMFNNTSFNQDVSDWDVSNVTNMSFMFASSPFDQDISNWDISSMLVEGGTANRMFYGTCSFSTANYDLLLVGWNDYVVPGTTGIRFNACNTKYSAGDPAIARANMNSYEWVIGDGGQV